MSIRKGEICAVCFEEEQHTFPSLSSKDGVCYCQCYSGCSSEEPHTCSLLVTVTALIENVLCVKSLFVSSVGPQREPSVRAINDLDQQRSPRSLTGSAGVLALSFITGALSILLQFPTVAPPATVLHSLTASPTMCNIFLSIILTGW